MSGAEPVRVQTAQLARVHLPIQVRAIVFLVYTALAYLLYVILTRSWIPSATGTGLWFLSVVGLLAFRLLSAPFFARPKDSLAATSTGVFVLWAIDLSASPTVSLIEHVRWISLLFLAVVALAAFLAIALGRAEATEHPGRALLARAAYDFSTQFGKGEVVFTPTALIGALGFEGPPIHAVLFTAAWVVLAVTTPLERAWLTARRTRTMFRQRAGRTDVGVIERIDDPGLVRVTLQTPATWTPNAVLGARLADGRCAHVLPLFVQTRDAKAVGTGLLLPLADDIADLTPGRVQRIPGVPGRGELLRSLLGEANVELVGFVVENSTIGAIQFEVACDHSLCEGYVVQCRVRAETVTYQITEARTAEEAFERNPRGTVLATAVQLGIPAGDGGFRRAQWPPTMNTPVFARTRLAAAPAPDGFVLGAVPGTNTWIRGNFNKIAEFHAAVLGVTGVGKTELVFDIVRHGLHQGAKIACVDFTEEYRARLADCNPERLGLTAAQVEDLTRSVEAVETGDYGGAAEKRALADFLRGIRPDVTEQVRRFLEEENSGLGIFELQDIANTRSTLRATELYLSELFAWARRNRRARQILVVLEEAHTVVPEANLFGYDKNETLAVIGRISQIALQGRKYGVGLLIVSQRTALVSKTILSQCATVVSFALVDKTSLEYLQAVFDEQHCKAIPNLPKRTAVAGGPGVVSERPVIIEIPYDEAKSRAAAALAARGPAAG